MAQDQDTIQQLIDQLARDRQIFVDTTTKTHELLQQTLAALKTLTDQQQNAAQPNQPSSPISSPAPVFSFNPFTSSRRESLAIGPPVTRAAQRTTTADIEVESLPPGKTISNFSNDGDDSSDTGSDDNESDYVQIALQPEEYDMEGLRNHLWEHDWTEAGEAILCGLNHDERALGRQCIFPMTAAEAENDRSNVSHYSIYNVGFDGVPRSIKPPGPKPPTRALEIWNRICTTNINTRPSSNDEDDNDTRPPPAAGRIIIVREPSPKLFAALHYTMNKHFDMDEVFELLYDDDPGLMFPHRAFARDPRHRRSFIVTLAYFTIVGDMCRPMAWQESEHDTESTNTSSSDPQHHETHIPITRCGSVIALALEGEPMGQVKNRDRRISDRYGDVFDPFSPWRVLSIQAYPDWHATTDTHKPTAHYVNGPEAFLYTLEAEFNDACKRLKEVYNRVRELVEPPPSFTFDSKIRERMLFEDDDFTFSKRYFWAYQTLSIINQDITEMIESYRDTFRESVWEGTNKIIWPGESGESSRYQQWRKRMAKLRRAIDHEVEKLEYIKSMNFRKMEDIEALRDNLFSGTSVMESRRSVQQTTVTVEQNRSVLLLTLITIFFLPLTFVTSVFGMTNMDPSESYFHFGWTALGICVPTYIFIGSLHTDAGLAFWRGVRDGIFAMVRRWVAAGLGWVGYTPSWVRTMETSTTAAKEADPTWAKRLRSKRAGSDTRLAMNMRMRQATATEDALSPTLSRLESRDRHAHPPPAAARLQPISGETTEAKFLKPPSRTRPTEIKFVVGNKARIHGIAEEDEGESRSISPRTGSPQRLEDENKSTSTEKNLISEANHGKRRSFLHRLWPKHGEDDDEGVGRHRPGV